MTEPFIGQISMLAFGWAPEDWALCNGQTLSVSDNAALYSLIGNQFGGNGTTTFALPDLRGRTPVGSGNGYEQSMIGGVQEVTLKDTEVGHTHTFKARKTDATIRFFTSPDYMYLGKTAEGEPFYFPIDNSLTQMRSDNLSVQGSGLAHNNMQPYTAINFVIATQGTYPTWD